MERAGCVCEGILMASMFAPVKRTVRGVSDFRAEKNSYLRRSSEELCYPKAATLENGLEEKVWVSKWDWRLVDHRWHLTSKQMDWFVASGASIVDLERCTDHLRVGGITETDSSFTKKLLWYLKSLRFFTAGFSAIFILKKLRLPGKWNRLQFCNFMWRSEVLFALEMGKNEGKGGVSKHLPPGHLEEEVWVWSLAAGNNSWPMKK